MAGPDRPITWVGAVGLLIVVVIVVCSMAVVRVCETWTAVREAIQHSGWWARARQHWSFCVGVGILGLLVVTVVGWGLKDEPRPMPPTMVRIQCVGPYTGHQLRADELSTVLSNHQAWLKSGAKPNDTRRADLCGAKFWDLSRFFSADLRWATLSGADLRGANLDKADLRWADLQEADLRGANVSRAKLQGADLYLANLAGTIYEPNPESLPLLWRLIGSETQLDKLVFHDTPAALVAQREAFKKAGMRTQERQLTYAIESTRRRQAWNPSWYSHGGADSRPWLEQFWGKLESGFKLVAFELPSCYGMSYGRPLKTLGGFIGLFSLVYMYVVLSVRGPAGIWMVWLPERVHKAEGEANPVRVTSTFFFSPLKMWAARSWRRGLSVLLIGLYFGLLSAFSLGWRELNVGTWIARIQPRAYVLRAIGCVRTVSGIQSLISVYLLALWALTYFGRPFE